MPENGKKKKIATRSDVHQRTRLFGKKKKKPRRQERIYRASQKRFLLMRRVRHLRAYANREQKKD